MEKKEIACAARRIVGLLCLRHTRQARLVQGLAVRAMLVDNLLAFVQQIGLPSAYLRRIWMDRQA